MEDLLKAIGNFGFPMVVSAYLLIRLETKLERIASSITELALTIRTLRDETEVHRDAGQRAG